MKKLKTPKTGTIYWLFIGLLSIGVVAVGVFLYFLFPVDKRIENLPQIIGSTGSLLTVIWFTASLFYQSRQITEQSKQFALSFNQLRQDSKRNAIESAKTYLQDAEKIFVERSGHRFSEAMTMLTEYGSIFRLHDETDPEVYMLTMPIIGKTEGSFQIMIEAFETAAKIYFDAIGFPYIVFDSPEQFLIILKDEIRKIPYFSQFDGSVYFIADVVDRLLPGRDAIRLGVQIAIALQNPTFFDHTKIKEAIVRYRSKHEKVPAIVIVYEGKFGVAEGKPSNI